MTDQELIQIAMAIGENDWDEHAAIQRGKYSISQFQGTAFDSDYACYKVQWPALNPGSSIVSPGKVSHTIVAKSTNISEERILQLLSSKHFPVPKVYAVLRSKRGTIMVFMELLPGRELYASTDDADWINAATELSNIHCAFWGGNSATLTEPVHFSTSNIVAEKIYRARENALYDRAWKAFWEMACRRIETAPKTLIHGDMFPTNILVHKEKTFFIDWANSGVSAYMMDLGRLTAIIDEKTMFPMCPCSEKVLKAYYEKMAPVLQMSCDDYLKDIHIAQFIELANIYCAPGFYGHDKKYNQLVKQRIDEIVGRYIN